MFSSTTMKLSTNMPTANEMPAKLSKLSERPKRPIIRNMPIMLVPMAVKITKLERTFFKNTNSTMKLRTAPSTTLSVTTSIEA